LKSTLLVHGTSVDFVQDAGTQHAWGRETASSSGTTLTFTQTCPTTKTTAATFTASGTTLTFFLVNQTGQVTGYTYQR
jgi:hypothetical protein